jgi:opacity protein-like surface antigen
MALGKRLAIVAIISMALIITPGWAAEAQEKNWDFSLAPLYLWAINIEGDSTLEGNGRETKLEFSDIFNDLEGAFTLNFSGTHKSRFGFMFDFLYLNVGMDKDTRINTVIDLDLKGLVSQLAGSYRVGESEKYSFDAMAGVRYADIELGIDLDRLPFSTTQGKELWDPIIGGRYQWHFAKKWNLNLYGDIGGFGVGSDFTWQTMGLIDFQPWKHVAISAGYRALEYQFEDDKANQDFELDLTLHGPIVGIRILF